MQTFAPQEIKRKKKKKKKNSVQLKRDTEWLNKFREEMEIDKQSIHLSMF